MCTKRRHFAVFGGGCRAPVSAHPARFLKVLSLVWSGSYMTRLWLTGIRLPSALLVRKLSQRLDEIELDDLAELAIDLVWGFSTAERTHELLLAGMPLGLATTGRAFMLF